MGAFFVQCPKMLWLKTYRPELAEEDPAAQDRMTKGNVIGDLAMGLLKHTSKNYLFTCPVLITHLIATPQ